MGVRAKRDAKGELAFNVSEKDWPQVRDSLAIRGGGRRFPTGQFNHVRTIVAEQSIQPSRWNAADPRKALQDIAQAQQLIRKSYGDVRGVLEEAARNVDHGATSSAQGAYWQGFAKEYADTLAQGDSAAISVTVQTVAGISKRTVSSLLAVAPGTT